jgi:septal ring factor EnvC (AmiA/AmiB activator)
MRRRSSKSETPLTEKQQELARREAQLRNEMQKLERMIAEAPRKAEETNRRQREEILARASEGSSRLDVSIALQDKRWGDGGNYNRPRVSLRKERREGRIIFLVLVIVLAAAVLWLASHLHF